MFAKSKTKGGKLKEPKVPIKGEKTKKAPKASVTAREKPSHLSEEYIQDTDKDGDADNVSTEGSSSGGDADSDSEDQARQNTKKPKVERAQKTELENVPVPDDTSDEGEGGSSESGEDESKEEEEGEEKTAGKKKETNGKKRKAEEVNGPKESKEPKSKKQKKSSKDEKKQSPSSSEVSDDSSAEEEKSQPAKKKTKAPSPQTSAPSTQHVVRAIPAMPYKPPQDYQPLDTTTTSLLSEPNLFGKEIWHITAPLSIPISQIQSVAFDAVQTGKPVLTHKNTDYILAEDTTGIDTAALFLPNPEGYAPASQKVQRTLHLQQKIALPNLSNFQANMATGSQAAGDVATAPVSSAKPQPTGLRMRYRPIGHVSGEPGMPGSDSEGEGQAAVSEGKKQKKGTEGVQFPKTLGEHGTYESTSGGKVGVSSPEMSKKDKKDKKKRKSKGGEEETAAKSSVPVTDKPTWDFDAISTKPEQNAAQRAVGEDTTMADVDETVVTEGAADHNSKEEKAKRKEERRLKREKKEARKAQKESGHE